MNGAIVLKITIKILTDKLNGGQRRYLSGVWILANRLWGARVLKRTVLLLTDKLKEMSDKWNSGLIDVLKEPFKFKQIILTVA